MVQKYVEGQLVEKETILSDNSKFDTITKLENSLNAMVIKKQNYEDEKRRQTKSDKLKSLVQLEHQVEKTLIQEATVALGV